MDAADTPSGPDDAWVIHRLMTIPDLFRTPPEHGAMSRFATFQSFVGTARSGLHLSVENGHIVEALPGPVLMKSWGFAFRATPEAWEEHWREIPKAGFHDILALTKRGSATLEGDMRSFLANLQLFKDLVALPRGNDRRVAA